MSASINFVIGDGSEIGRYDVDSSAALLGLDRSFTLPIFKNTRNLQYGN